MPKTNKLISVFWDKKFKEEKTSWGYEPADSAIRAKDFFVENNIKDILIPGIGYGRNAKIFLSHGVKVTGIEISQNAIDLARSMNNLDISIYRGSVTEMPFDSHKYQGIFCYAVIHLLNKPQRAKLVEDCYKQLCPGGYMIFIVISGESHLYGSGKLLSKNRFRINTGLDVFFYDQHSIYREFGKFGLVRFEAVDEPIKHLINEPPLKCYYIICKRR